MDLDNNPLRNSNECHSLNSASTDTGILESAQHNKKRKLEVVDVDDISAAGPVHDEELIDKEDTILVDSNDKQTERDYRRRFGHLNPVLERKIISVARPDMQMKGHTAFLTFAVAPFKHQQPISVSSNGDENLI